MSSSSSTCEARSRSSASGDPSVTAGRGTIACLGGLHVVHAIVDARSSPDEAKRPVAASGCSGCRRGVLAHAARQIRIDEDELGADLGEIVVRVAGDIRDGPHQIFIGLERLSLDRTAILPASTAGSARPAPYGVVIPSGRPVALGGESAVP